MTELQEAMLIDLLRQHPTPTEVVRKALGASACEIRLTFDPVEGLVDGDLIRFARRKIIVRDVNHRPKAKGTVAA